jgi:hypothetical protein
MGQEKVVNQAGVGHDDAIFSAASSVRKIKVFSTWLA